MTYYTLEDVFPAYAGMFLWLISPVVSHGRFPRVCGDVPLDWDHDDDNDMFSPRMRGCSVTENLSSTTATRFPRVCGDVPPNGLQKTQ